MPTKVERIEQEIARLRQERVLAAREERQERRKLDTRAKILIGSALLALLAAGDRPARRVYNAVREHLAKDRRQKTHADLEEWDAGDGAKYAQERPGAGAAGAGAARDAASATGASGPAAAGGGAPPGAASLTGPPRPGESHGG